MTVAEAKAARMTIAAVIVAFLVSIVLLQTSSRPAGALVGDLTIADYYESLIVDSPAPVPGGGFGGEFINVGDNDGDGADDLLVSQQTGEGRAFVISGATGATLLELTPPDASTIGNAARFGLYLAEYGDVASCPAGEPSQICPTEMANSDGVSEFLVSASGVDFPPAFDLGRVYLFDGATGAVLKRIDMPSADRALQAAMVPQPRPDFGRSILVPSSDFPDVNGNLPRDVEIGNLVGPAGIGSPDVVVAASFFRETASTHAACTPGPCMGSGRVYVYGGEDIVGTSPAEVLESPVHTLQNPLPQTDNADTSFQQPNSELFGFSTVPVGDLGGCNVDPGPGAMCVNASSTTAPDGRPDYAVAEPRYDLTEQHFDSGIAWLIDGPTGSILARYNHPRPESASALGLGIYNQPAIGDVAGTSHPDFFLPSMNQEGDYIAQGTGWVFNGNFKTTASFIALSRLDDPTPSQAGNFGSSSSGIGDVSGDLHNELIVGGAGPRFPGTDDSIKTDVHIFSAVSAQVLYTFQDPDDQLGANFGGGVAPLGDLNDDGVLDFAVGSTFYDGSVVNQGRLYIFKSAIAPTPTPTPTEAGRTVSLRLKRHLRAVGAVSASTESLCEASVPVKIKRNGDVVKRTTTDADGSYNVKLPDKQGRYTAVGPTIVEGEITCLRARSHTRRHTH